MNNRTIKVLKRTGLFVLSLLILFIILALIYIACTWLLPKIEVKAVDDGEPKTDTVYLLTNGAHTDIVLCATTRFHDWTQFTPRENTLATDSTYDFIGIGWGDKGFYMEIPTWDDLTFRVAFNAAFGLGGTAMHTTYMRRPTVGTDCIELQLSASQYQRLIDYLRSGFLLDASGQVILIDTDAVYGLHDSFYEGTSRYTLFHTCNTWTNNALKVSGQKACFWTAYDTAIFKLYQK